MPMQIKIFGQTGKDICAYASQSTASPPKDKEIMSKIHSALRATGAEVILSGQDAYVYLAWADKFRMHNEKKLEGMKEKLNENE